MRCDRRHMRLYAVTDRAWLGSRTLCEQVEAALKGGVTCVQLREKELEEEAFLQEARELCALCRRYGVPFLVNDRVDIALASGADGVHVGQEDMDPAQVRLRAGEDLILGVSVAERAHPDRHPASSALPRSARSRRDLFRPAAVFFNPIMSPVLPVPWGT